MATLYPDRAYAASVSKALAAEEHDVDTHLLFGNFLSWHMAKQRGRVVGGLLTREEARSDRLNTAEMILWHLNAAIERSEEAPCGCPKSLNCTCWRG